MAPARTRARSQNANTAAADAPIALILNHLDNDYRESPPRAGNVGRKRLSRQRRLGSLYTARSSSIEVVQPDGHVVSAQIKDASPPWLDAHAAVGADPGVDLFLEINRTSSGIVDAVYSFDAGRLVSAGVTLGYGGDSASRAGFDCVRGSHPRVVQNTLASSSARRSTRGGTTPRRSTPGGARASCASRSTHPSVEGSHRGAKYRSAQAARARPAAVTGEDGHVPRGESRNHGVAPAGTPAHPARELERREFGQPPVDTEPGARERRDRVGRALQLSEQASLEAPTGANAARSPSPSARRRRRRRRTGARSRRRRP